MDFKLLKIALNLQIIYKFYIWNYLNTKTRVVIRLLQALLKPVKSGLCSSYAAAT